VKRSLALLLVAAVAVVALPACGVAGQSAAATVNGRAISAADFQSDLAGLASSKSFRDALAQQGVTLREGVSVPTSLATQWLLSLVQQEAITQLAKRRGVVATAQEIAQTKAQLQTDAGFRELPARLQRRIVESSALIGALRASYPSQSTYDVFAAACPSQRLVGHILVRTEAEAEDVVRRLDNGEPFAQVSNEVSIDTGAKSQGGLLACEGAGQWSQFDETFRTAAEAVPTGGISAPVQTQFGFHVIEVLPLTEANAQPLLASVQPPDPVQPAIARFLNRAKVTVDPRYGKVDRSGGGFTIAPPSPPSVKSRPATTTTTAPAPPGAGAPAGGQPTTGG
jgi:hypothetical protein